MKRQSFLKGRAVTPLALALPKPEYNWIEMGSPETPRVWLKQDRLGGYVTEVITYDESAEITQKTLEYFNDNGYVPMSDRFKLVGNPMGSWFKARGI